MKTQLTISRIAILVLILTGFLMTSCYYINRQNGSGRVIKVEHPVSGFNKINLGIIFDAVIIPSAAEKVIVETDDNLQQYVIVNKSDSTLNVQMKNNINIGHHSAGKIYIFTKSIRSAA